MIWLSPEAIAAWKPGVYGSGSNHQAGQEGRATTVEQESSYHQQERVENAFFGFKTILCGGLCARNSAAHQAEAIVACHVRNRMTEL